MFKFNNFLKSSDLPIPLNVRILGVTNAPAATITTPLELKETFSNPFLVF